MEILKIDVCRVEFGDISKEDEKNMIKILGMKNIAVIGMSPKKERAGYYVPFYLKDRGYHIIPVRPGIGRISDLKCYKTLLDIDEDVEVVNVFMPSKFCPQIAKDAVKIGAKAIWLQEGIISDEAKQIAINNGLIFIMDFCIKKAYDKYIKKHLYCNDGKVYY